MSTTTFSSKIEDWLPYIIPAIVALAGFNWASLIPGDNNGFFVALALGFLAKLLIGIQQSGWKSWEDLVPTASIALGFLATALSTNPQFLNYGTEIGFVVKALGYFQDKTHPVEDLFLAIGAFLALYGTYTGNAEVGNAGALLALIGKTVPSLSSTGFPQTPAAATPSPTG